MEGCVWRFDELADDIDLICDQETPKRKPPLSGQMKFAIDEWTKNYLNPKINNETNG